MIFPKDTAVVVYGFFTSSGSGATGLTVTFTAYEGTTGTPVVSAQSATELGGGFYYYTLTAGTVDANAAYTYKFIAASGADQLELPGIIVTPAWATNVNTLAFTGTDVNATLDGETVTVGTNNDKTGYGLADDAITAAKYDETTAFPIKFADVAGTTIARTGADGDTLELLSDQIDLVATAAALATTDGKVDSILADTNELQTDWVDGGRLDLIIDAILADTNELQTNQGNWLTATGFSTHSAADAADAVWDEVLSGHLVAGSTGAALNAAGSAGDPWTTTLPGAYTGSQAGKILADILVDTGTTLDANITAILADTNELQTDWADGGRLDLIIDAILADTNELQTNQGNWLTATGFNTDTTETIVDAIWDESLVAGTHNVTTSAGRRLRELAVDIVWSGTAAGGGNTYIDLDNGASAIDGTYDPSTVIIVSGPGMGQSRDVWQYDGSLRRCYVNRDWKVNPDNTSEFMIKASPGNGHVNEGLAQGGGASTITLNTLASAVDNAYNDQVVFIAAGTGADQAKHVLSYNGTSKVATVDSPWTTQPDATSIYAILPNLIHEPPTVTEITADIDANSTQLAAIVADTNELQTNQGNWLTATGFSTFNAASDKVFLGDGAHGGASATLTLSDYSNFTGGVTAAAIADAVWDELLSGHAISGSAGAGLSAAGSAGDPWATALPGSYVAGTAGYMQNAMNTALTSSNAIITAASDASTLNIRRGDTMSIAFTSLGTITGYTNLWFTLKRNPDHSDSEAEVQIDSTTGLLYLNGSAGTAAKGSISVSDASAGDMTVTLDETETAQLAIRNSLYYDVQALVGGVVSTLASGRANVIYDVTKSTS